ncbi:uncharacterized protein LOC141856824 [Brevipalpus obovatus]|uniref:uncharacterized protein LOC141856824 n=1 Tax=Brevipalpus obovatus TaxID=246614 RepID=UPI003D9F7A67
MYSFMITTFVLCERRPGYYYMERPLGNDDFIVFRSRYLAASRRIALENNGRNAGAMNVYYRLRRLMFDPTTRVYGQDHLRDAVVETDDPGRCQICHQEFGGPTDEDLIDHFQQSTFSDTYCSITMVSGDCGHFNNHQFHRAP